MSRILSVFVLSMMGLLWLTPSLSAETEHPKSNPKEVIVKGRKVSHFWKNGRIYVPASELRPLLNLGPEVHDYDLIKALEDKGGYLWTYAHGVFEARQDPSRFTQAAQPDAWAHNRQQVVNAYQAQKDAYQEKLKGGGELHYQVRKFTADTGYVRAFVRVTNHGPGPSDPTEMVCYFQDGFGKSYARDTRTLASMAAGESQDFEIFSVVREKDTSMTVTNDTVAINFYSLTDPSKNPKNDREKRKQQRDRKI